MLQLRNAVLLLFCSLEHRTVGLLDSHTLLSTGWLQLLVNVVKIHLLAPELPAKQVVQVFHLASSLSQVCTTSDAQHRLQCCACTRKHSSEHCISAGS